MTDESEQAPPTGPGNAPVEPEGQSAVVAVSSGPGARYRHEELEIPDRLPLLPIRDTVAFPGTVMPLRIRRRKPKRVLDLALAGTRMIAVVAQRSADVEDPGLDDLYRVGTACVILKILKLADGTENIIIHGLRRIGIEAFTHEGDYLEASVHAYEEPASINTEQEALAHSIRTGADRIVELSPNIPDEAREVLNSIDAPGRLGDFMAANLPLGLVHKQEILETFDVVQRLRKVNLAVAAQLDVLELSNKIQEQVRGQVDKSQREYYLREQMKAIRKELGERDERSETLIRLRKRIEDAKMPEAVAGEAVDEVERIEHIPRTSPEYSMALDYVEWLVELPWSVSTEDRLDLRLAKQALDEDHYGLEKVKKRILEFLAVRTLKKDSPGPILCFAGPPGVGKTSLGQSIARAMGRKFIRISLGGIRDEAAIRGHRRTYIGAMPGRIIREIKRAGSNNPLFMLDEVDKIAQDARGDPMSALLEVLDPAQNSTFSDHYLGVPFDLSKVLFITTANYLYAIEPALRDRMEIIELGGYTRREKLIIARKYLLPRQLEQNGITPEQLQVDDDVLSTIIADYTREAGVRSLERKIGAICRSRAAAVVGGEKIRPKMTVDDLRTILGPRDFESEVAATASIPGVVTGLAFTATGGEILFIEAAMMPGNGQLQLTGQLGDVMRESAVAASSIIRGYASLWAGKTKATNFGRIDTHIHVPAGAVPKDGPSAGAAILTAMVSVLTGQVVNPLTGMTGEITLSGRILGVGGIREKVLAAHRAGLTRVILPARNEPDLEEVPEDIREQIEFVFIRSIKELLNIVFDRNAGGGRVRKSAKKKITRKTTGKKQAKRKAAKKVKTSKRSKRIPKKKPAKRARRGGRPTGAAGKR